METRLKARKEGGGERRENKERTPVHKSKQDCEDESVDGAKARRLVQGEYGNIY